MSPANRAARRTHMRPARATVGLLCKWTVDDEVPDPAHPAHRVTSWVRPGMDRSEPELPKEIAAGEAAVAVLAGMGCSSPTPGSAARTWLSVRPRLTPRAGPTNAA